MTLGLRAVLVLILSAVLAVPLVATAQATRADSVTAPVDLQVDRVLGFGHQNAVSCTAGQFCMVVGDNGHAATFSAGTLTRRLAFPLLDERLYFYGPVGLSCLSATFCVAVGRGASSTFDGTRWSAPIRMAFLGSEARGSAPPVSCTGPAFCISVSGINTWAAWNGTRWHTRTGGPHLPALADRFNGVDVSCASTAFCVAAVGFVYDEIGGAARLFTWNGSVWRESADEVGLSSNHPVVSCATTTFCRAWEAGVLRTWDGSHWTDSANSGYRELIALRCFADRRCIGAREEVHRDIEIHLRRVDGTTWPDLGTIPGASFPVGGRPRTEAAVDCWSADGCQIALPSNRSLRWTDSSGFDPTDRLGDRLYDAVDVSCAASEFCGAVNDLGELGLLRDGAWSVPVPLGGGAGASALSCTSGRCVVVTDRGVAVRITPDGSTSAQKQIDTVGITAISCAGSGFCVAIDTLGRVVRYEDGAWHTPTQRSPDGVLRSVSCVSRTFCMVAGHGVVTTYRGDGRWTPPTRIGDYAGPVSCVSAHACVLGAKDAIVRWDGRSFSTPVPLIDGGTLVVRLSCTDETHCLIDLPSSHVVLDGTMQESTYLPLGASSCWDATACLIVGDADHAYITRAGPEG